MTWRFWKGNFEGRRHCGKVMFNEKACIQNVQVRGVQRKCCARTGVQNYRQNIFWGNERTVLFQDILEKVCIFGALPPRPHLPIQGSCLVLFERKLWKEKGTREARSKNSRSAIQSSFLKVSKRKLWQDKCFLNSGTQDLPSKYQSRERCARTGAQDCR